MRAPMLFSPGPVLVKDSVRHALLHYDICHRGTEFEKLFQDTQEKIIRLFQADNSYYSLLISGSGTSANETCLASITKGDEEILLISNGMFGDRLEEIIDKYKIPKIKLNIGWADIVPIEMVRQALQDNPKITVVAMVFHETSTSMINPVHEIGQIVKDYNKIFFVDCVSAAGGEFINVVNNNIDICTSVGGKCVGAFPGSAYICAKEALLKVISVDQGKNVYLNLGKHYVSAKTNHQTPNTPNVNLIWALYTAIDIIVEKEGIEKRINRYKECSRMLREGLKNLGIEFLIPDDLMSNTVTSAFLPSNVNLKDFINVMEDDGYVIYSGKGKYEKMGMFQVANMGEIYPSDCVKFLEAFERNIKRLSI